MSRRAIPTNFLDVLAAIVADSTDLSAEQLGALMRLLHRQAQSRAPLPDDPVRLAELAHLTPEAWAEVAERVLDKFTRTPAGWVHGHLVHIIRHLEAVSASRSAAGQRAAFARHHPAEAAAWREAQEGKPEPEAPATAYLPGFEPEALPDVAPAAVRGVPPAAVRGAPAAPVDNGAPRMRDACATHHTHTHALGAGPFSNGCSSTPTPYARTRVREGVRVRACVSVREAPAAAPSPEALAAVVDAIQAEGVTVLPGDPVLARLVAWGLAPECFAAVVRDARARSSVADPFRWAMTKCGALVREAQRLDVDDRVAPSDSLPPPDPERAPPLPSGPPEVPEDADDRRARSVGYVTFAQYRALEGAHAGVSDARRAWGEQLRMHVSLFHARARPAAPPGVRP